MADVDTTPSEAGGNNATPEVEVETEVDLGGPEVQTAVEPTKGSDNTTMASENTNGDAETAPSASTSKRPTSQDNAGEATLPPTKRTRTAAAGAQRRLFGVLTKTLNKFQEETKKDTGASKRRQELEERLAAKKREENEAIAARTGHERARRNLRFEIMKKEDEKNAFSAIHRSRRSSKTSLANFLCTKSDETLAATNASSSASLGSLKPAPMGDLPHALPPTSTHSSSSTKPLYYLPYKLLPWQADKIDGQIEDMKADLDKEEEDWTAELQRREEEITELKSKLSEMTGGDASEDAKGSRRSRPLATDGDDSMDHSLSERAPLPNREDRDELNGDERAGSSEVVADREDTAMAGAADGDDRLEY